ncbi:calcium-dependent protein kinase, putative [Ricinus communis]|uniref:Calcium-dependent protein kinase, putative n=1 Tax=Ricinus communis TaxID=3988 RepID=B9S787_RICCO|nr:calcium-dependent protein kinase, putative [Ricinus communis]
MKLFIHSFRTFFLHYPFEEENSQLKVIDFWLIGLFRPDLSLLIASKQITTCCEFCATYDMVWSIGVIAYILRCGGRPFWAKTESGIFRAVLRADPSLDESLWPSLSPKLKDSVKRLLHKDSSKRILELRLLSDASFSHNFRPSLDMES